jgi:hypothetical protein
MGVYKTVAAPTLTAGFLVQPESRIMMGTVALYGSLEVASWTYATYEASIGLQAGTSFDIGLVDKKQPWTWVCSNSTRAHWKSLWQLAPCIHWATRS